MPRRSSTSRPSPVLSQAVSAPSSTHSNFDALVAQPGFADALVSLLAKHLVIRIDAPPFNAESLAAIAARLGPPSVNKGPRLPGFDSIIQFDSPASRMPIRSGIATPRKCCITTLRG